MSYDVPHMPGETDDAGPSEATHENAWSLWEVFVRQRRGLNHVHVGSVHAADVESALQNARDAYLRRVEGVSIWVVSSNQIHATDPDEADAMFEPFSDKPYRHPTFYDIPEEVGYM